MTRRFVAAIRGFARQRGIEIVSFRRGERKDDRTREFLRGRGGEGVLYIGKAQEKARVLRTQRRLWRLFGGIVALAGLVVAALELLP